MNATILNLLSVFIGASVTLVVTAVTLWYNGRVDAKRIHAEETLKIKQRQYEAKRNCIARLSEAAARYYLYLTALPDRDPKTGGELEPESKEFTVAISSVHYFCSIQTINAALSLSYALNKAYANASKIKLQLIFIKTKIKDLESRISSIQKENIELNRRIEYFVFNKDFRDMVSRLSDFINRNSEQIQGLREEKSKLFKEQLKAQEKCRDIILKEIYSIEDEAVNFIVTARQELGFSIEKEHYSAIVSQHLNSEKELVIDLFAYLREEIDKAVLQAEQQ